MGTLSVGGVVVHVDLRVSDDGDDPAAVPAEPAPSAPASAVEATLRLPDGVTVEQVQYLVDAYARAASPV